VNEQEGRPGSVRATTDDPRDSDSGVITYPKFRMWLRPDGIVQLVWAPRVTMDLVDAIAAIDAMTRLTGGRRTPPPGGRARHRPAGPAGAH